MGQVGSRTQREARVLLLGLDNAGKTSILYKLKYSENVVTVPTIGFNVEMIDARKNRKDISLTVWDVGGQRMMRQHWKSFYPDTAAVVLVVDCSDKRRLDEARQELEHSLRSELLRGRPLVIFANKQDVSGAETVTELTERFNLRQMCASRNWFVQPCSATTGVGLQEGFQRVAHLIKVPGQAETIHDNLKDTVHYLRSKSVTY